MESPIENSNDNKIIVFFVYNLENTYSKLYNFVLNNTCKWL